MRRRNLFLVAALAALFAASAPAFAHCDTLDGPVVGAARKALATGDVNGVLIWVKQGDEAAIRQAFDLARTVRKSGGPATELADRYFFETLVRVHRAGEGAPYTGLKPAGQIDPGVAAADRAIAPEGRIEDVAALLGRSVERGLHAKYESVVRTRRFDPRDVEAGRRHVGAYVEYVHYVERVHDAAAGEAAADAAPAAAHAH